MDFIILIVILTNCLKIPYELSFPKTFLSEEISIVSAVLLILNLLIHYHTQIYNRGKILIKQI